MRRQMLLSVFVATASLLAQSTPILGVASAPKPFSLDSVQTKPEAGPVSVVEGDEVVTAVSPVTFRLTGENRAILGGNSSARIRGLKDGGAYFYLSNGSIQFDTRKQPLAICALDRLYLPSVPGSGEVSIRDNAVQVKMTAGLMIRSGIETCDAKVAPSLPTEPTPAATVTATATAAGAGSPATTRIAVAVTTATAAGIAATIALSQPPPPESQILPGQ